METITVPKMNLIEFMDSVSDEEVASAYAELFCEIEGEHSRHEAENVGFMLFDEVKEAISARKEKCRISENDIERFIFSTIIPDPSNEDNGAETAPIVDISIMRYSSIPRIPDYMSSHPFISEYAEVTEDYEIRDLVYESNTLSFPILLTPLDELMKYDVYYPDGDDTYPASTAASIIYELSIFGGTIEECESKKKELSENIRNTAIENGYEYDNADEILREITPPMDPEKLGEDVFLEKMLTARYNARIGIYDRIYCDAVIASQNAE